MIKFIYARSLNGVIGHQGQMPWNVPEDLANFKLKTTGHVVVMGRKTWDSLPNTFKPLPDRTNVVISSSSDSLLDQPLQPQLVIAADTALEVVKTMAAHDNEKDVWIIGGAKTFELFMDVAEEIHETIIREEIEGDTVLGFEPSTLPAFYATVGPGISAGWMQSKNGTIYRFNTYLRKPASAMVQQNKPWEVL